MSTPVFAVVGHPNKGKSSIVATLAQDDSVRIAPESGTTQSARRYPMRLDDEVLYVLVDTPGFQRARHVLHWMKKHESSAAQHPKIVADFLTQHQHTQRYADECQLLQPIVEGAGILYVVDGSKPYGPEYEAEMEILRWTGQPSMALINPIGPADFIDEWKNALGQYFKVVRVFDALTAEFQKRLELLRAFGALKEEWSGPLQRAVASLNEDRRHKAARAARTIVHMLADLLSHQQTQPLPPDTEPDSLREKLQAKLMQTLRQRESQCRKDVERIYGHFALNREEGELEILNQDLFSEETWSLFGLSRGELVGAGMAGGAAVGAGVDLAAGGASLLLGAALGAIAGGTLAWFSSQQVADIKVIHRPLGGRSLRCGPVKNLNFPFVVLGRARFHHLQVAGRTHAQRETLQLAATPGSDAQILPRLSDTHRKRLAVLFKQLNQTPSARSLDPDHHDELVAILTDILITDVSLTD